MDLHVNVHPADAELDRLARLAAQVLRAPVTVVSLIDGEEQSVPIRVGLPATWVSETTASQLCRTAARLGRPLVLPNAGAVRRTSGRATRLDAGVAACLAAPLVGADGRALGALCAIDRRARAWRPAHVRVIVELAAVIASLLDGPPRHDIGRPNVELLSSISHDLLQPLTAIKGHSQLLRRAIEHGVALPVADVASRLTDIVDAANRMSAQLRELIDLSSAQLGHPVGMVLRRTDLVAILRQAVSDHQRGVETIAVAFATNEVTLEAVVDGARIRRLIDNLLGNAVKYSQGDGAVIVSLERDADGFAVIEIRDQGIGIPAADLPHVTERFYRGANVGGIVAGSGIGLAGARQIVEEHGGSLSVESVEGRGTIVTARLPLPLLPARTEPLSQAPPAEESAAPSMS